MGRHVPCPGVLHDFVECSDPEDLSGEPSTPRVRHASEVFPDDPTLSVRGRRIEADVSVVEGIAEVIDPFGRTVDATTYRRWTEAVGKSD